jgi:thiosulfate/3-mercaptopyruvate sulfurtransferase
MKTLSFLVASIAFAAQSFAAQALLSPQELQAKLNDPQVRIIDIRDAKTFAADHIPGAVHASYRDWRGPDSSPGELPPLPKLTKLVQSLGLTPATHAVVVSSGADASDFGASARVYWTLKVLGLKELSVLNGGVKAWSAAKLPMSKDENLIATSRYEPQLDASLIATTQEVAQRIKSGDSVLIDARPEAFFNGETRMALAKVPGTLPGAVNLRHDKWFANGSSEFVPLAQARQIAAASPIDPAKETVSFCNTGHWAATNWFAMSEVLGQKNVKLYPGSMTEWSRDPSLPMQNVPSRFAQLVIDTKLWADKTLK